MKDPAQRLFSRTPVPGAHDPAGPLGTRRTGGGFGVLPFVGDPGPAAPATDASWAWSLRRLARAAVWLLPAYAVLSGTVAMASDGGVGNDPYPADGQPLYLLGWVAAIWLGLLALLALTGLLAATRSRRGAVAGLLTSIGGTVLMLPFAGLAAQTPVFGTTARMLVLLGATCYTAGWLLTGWAVARSGAFAIGDGVMLMIAAPCSASAARWSARCRPSGRSSCWSPASASATAPAVSCRPPSPATPPPPASPPPDPAPPAPRPPGPPW